MVPLPPEVFSLLITTTKSQYSFLAIMDPPQALQLVPTIQTLWFRSSVSEEL
jgi:hypothetical protein